MSKQVKRYCWILLMVFGIVISVAMAENDCEHDFRRSSREDWYLVETVSEEGHLYRYYADWECSKCGTVAVLPLDRPSFPDEFVPHSYSVKTRHRLSENGDHVFDLRCAVDGCTLVFTKTHSGTTLHEDQGHVSHGVHRYIYLCGECTALIPVEKSCPDENCPIQIYKKQPEVEVE